MVTKNKRYYELDEDDHCNNPIDWVLVRFRLLLSTQFRSVSHTRIEATSLNLLRLLLSGYRLKRESARQQCRGRTWSLDRWLWPSIRDGLGLLHSPFIPPQVWLCVCVCVCSMCFAMFLPIRWRSEMNDKRALPHSPPSPLKKINRWRQMNQGPRVRSSRIKCHIINRRTSRGIASQFHHNYN